MAKELKLDIKNGWDILKGKKRDDVTEFIEGYKAYLDAGKTERECVKYTKAMLENAGFKALDTAKKVKAGDKLYTIIKDKGIAAVIIGKEPLKDGLNMLGAHIDSPRLDLKPMPLYEDAGMAFLKTHYYGGIKKYQWSTIPLSMHGVIFDKEGTRHEINIGEDEGDPVFCINELLIHISQEQMTRSAAEAVKAEELNILFTGIPCDDEKEKERVKLAALMLLNEKYGITEKDFISAEIEVVPAFKAKDVGLDRAFIGSYGQDDRVCAYTQLQALLSVKTLKRSGIIFLYDKEEVGSGGNTGAQSRIYENIVAELLEKSGGYTDFEFRKCIEKSKMLSADVTSAFDPTYAGAYDKLNSSFAGKGMAINKYSGARGKAGGNDANSEYMDKVMRLLDRNGISWQTGEIGRVDLGGGGTIAIYAAVTGLDVIDCGVPVLSMHAPFEVTSKADVYSTYLGFKAFLEEME
ncbi:MAG: aminopeptidase [Lachnospiraceae bacterium]|nr:aminopeptidase [Lachnospiraceae bacterium]